MAGYRQFHTKFWKDEWSIDLDPLERYLFIYLFSNDLSSISGIYRIPLRVIANETGLEIEYVKAALEKFEQQQKILYRDNTLWVVNMQKYHNNASELTQKKVTKDIDTVPDNVVKQAYLCFRDTGIFCVDTISIRYAYQSLKAKAKDKSEIKDESEAEAKTIETPSGDDNDIPETPYKPLEEAYCKATGTYAPIGGGTPTKKWVDAFLKMNAIPGVAPGDITEALAILVEKDYQVVGPSSIINTVQGVVTNRNIKKNNNGSMSSKRVDTSLDDLIRSGK